MNKLYVLVVTVAALAALAGDDYLGSSFDVRTGSAPKCSPALRAKQNHAVRCTKDTFVRVSDNPDANFADVVDPIASSNKLYDVATTATQQYLCTLDASDGGVDAGVCYIYLHRERGE